MIIENNFKNYFLYDFSYNGFPELRSELFLRKQISNVSLNEKPAKSVHEPLSRRTKQEIRSAQKVGLYMYLVVFDSFVKLCNLNNLQAEIYTCISNSIKIFDFNLFTDGSSVCEWSSTLGQVSVSLQLHVDQKYILIPRLESDFLLYSNACVMELTQFCSDLPGACWVTATACGLSTCQRTLNSPRPSTNVWRRPTTSYRRCSWQNYTLLMRYVDGDLNFKTVDYL